MQGKGVVRFFLILLALVCAYQLYFFIPANRVENAAENYAEQKAAGLDGVERTRTISQARRQFLDSAANEPAFSLFGMRDFTYTEVKQQQIKLGLDLKGGYSAVLQVDLRKFLEQLSGYSQDAAFVAALDQADEALKDAQDDYITLFVDAFRDQAAGRKLADIFVNNEALRDKISFESSDGEVAAVLRDRADETVNLTYTLLKERIDRTGVVQPNITLDEGRDLIVAELPGVDNAETARSLLSAAAALDIFDVYNVNEDNLYQSLFTANAALTEAYGEEGSEEETITPRYAIDSLGQTDSTSIVGYDTSRTQSAGVLFSILQPNAPNANTATIGYVDRADRERLRELIETEEFASAMPRDAVVRISQKPFEDQAGELTTTHQVYALRTNGNGEPALSGTHIIEADQSVDVQNNNEVQVNFTLDPSGAQEWGRITTERVGRQFAIVLDDEVVSAPSINEPIIGGRSRITGGFTIQEAEDLATKLEVGRLPTETQIIQESIVGPSLGQANINDSVRALLIGFALVLIFMILYYAGGGVVSIIALLANIFYLFGALSSFGTVLTLPGIAGIVLTIGMAVDANVIIYERIREELRLGKSTAQAVRDGFNASYSAIIDANVTTFMTAAVLFVFGLGPIKGFAAVLMIGVFTSVFTAVLVTLLIIDNRISKGKELSFWTGFSRNVLAEVNIDWMSKRRVGYAISGVLLVASIVSIVARGFDLGVDLEGGYSYTVAFAGDEVDRDVLQNALTASFEGNQPVVKKVDGTNTFSITTSFQIDNADTSAQRIVDRALLKGVQTVDAGATAAGFFTPDQDDATRIISASKVGPTIADDIRSSSWQAGGLALVLIFFYLFVRFSRWEFSAGAVMALFHDVIITLGVFSMLHGLLPFSMEVDQAFIAAILTVIGYSVNDTVIVFDRIREYVRSYSGRTKSEIFNLAINSTLSRTLITSGTTLIVVFMLFAFGGGSIRGFAFALLIGILVGTYSSIFVASATVHDLVDEIEPKNAVVAPSVTPTVARTSTGSFTRAAEAKSA